MYIPLPYPVARRTSRSTVRLILVILLLAMHTFGVDVARAARPDYSAFAFEVMDGDTLRIRRGDRFEVIRLIGVDTPEIHDNERAHRQSKRTRRGMKAILEMGRRAHAFTRTLVRRGDLLRIELGETPRDRYGRTLAYVYLADGAMLNEELLRKGYAYLLTYEDNQRYLGLLRNAAREARARGAGLFEATPRK